MIKHRPSYYVILRYALYQLPAAVAFIIFMILLRIFFYIPEWIVWVSSVIWVAKDAAMFPFVWRAYDKYSSDSVIGSRGKAAEHLSPDGYIMVRGELWRAKVVNENHPVKKGDPVRVQEIRGLTLLVRPEEGEKY